MSILLPLMMEDKRAGKIGSVSVHTSWNLCDGKNTLKFPSKF